jgi:hypothetical protein
MLGVTVRDGVIDLLIVMLGVIEFDTVTVGVVEFDTVTVGVIVGVTVGVLVGVLDGVVEAPGVLVGDCEFVIVGVTVFDIVCEGVSVGDGVGEGMNLVTFLLGDPIYIVPCWFSSSAVELKVISTEKPKFSPGCKSPLPLNSVKLSEVKNPSSFLLNRKAAPLPSS